MALALGSYRLFLTFLGDEDKQDKTDKRGVSAGNARDINIQFATHLTALTRSNHVVVLVSTVLKQFK